ncbi:DUF1642 domain-containing protein [Ruoffia sp. FAM 20858]|uniref:DUF1642 domain-containing protein n=1 Tax=Ruoffia sp. FAM 20858 TaxID=3259516 RepID=UPI003889BF75
MSEQLYVIIFKAQQDDSMFGIYNCYVEHTTVMKNGKFARYKGIDTCYFNPTIPSDGYWFTREHHPVTKDAIAKETRLHFTEKEIKEIDERYWLFAVPVEKATSSIAEALKKG